MKKLIPWNTSLWLLIAIVFQSCQKEESIPTKMSSRTTKAADNAQGVLGKKLDIPYTVGNMQKALNEVMASFKHQLPQSKLAKSGKTVEIQPSHYYYRFLPKDSTEYERLATDTVLLTSNAPLDYEITIDGDYFDDEGTEEDNSFGFQYTVFPSDYGFPQDIAHQKLNDLYFAPEEETGTMEKGEITVQHPQFKTSKELAKLDENGELFEFLELEALKLTNNLEEDELETLRFFLPNDPSGRHYTHTEALALGYSLPQLRIDYIHLMAQQQKGDMDTAARWWKRKKWNPYGRLTVHEDAIGRNVGVVGAEVRVRKWGLVVIKRARTNAKGEFKTSSTKTKRVKYAVYFNSPFRFTVKAGSVFIDARHRGTRTYKKEGWHQHFSYGRGKFYALVHNAAYDYHSRLVPQYGLRRPRFSRISAKYSLCGSSQHRPDILTLLPTSDIRVTRRYKDDNKNCIYRGSDGIYATTIHELTHAGHRELDPGMFSIFHSGNCERLLMSESWAEGVETIVTNDRYSKLSSTYFNINNDNIGWNNLRQRSKVSEMTEYTPVVADLIDNINQHNEFSYYYPMDRVKNYKLSQIQRALDNCRTLDCWKNNLRNYYYNPSEQHLNELFGYVKAVLTNNNPERCN